MTTKITFRPIREKDMPLLLRVFESTRPDVALSTLPDEQKSQFLQMQFRAQHQQYQARFPHAEYLLVLRENVAVGRLYVDRREDEIRILDLAILPEHRRQGIGSSVVAGLLNDADRVAKPVRIFIEKQHGGELAWYERLGFETTEEIETHILMQWRPRSRCVLT